MEIINCSIFNYLKGESNEEKNWTVENPFDKGIVLNFRELLFRNTDIKIFAQKKNKDDSIASFFPNNELEQKEMVVKMDEEAFGEIKEEKNSSVETSIATKSEAGEVNSEIDAVKYFEGLCVDFKQKFYIPNEQILFSVLQINCPVQKKALEKLKKKIHKKEKKNSGEQIV